MSSLWLPSQSPVTLALREPNLLVPGRKPVGPVEIDWANPINRGLVFAYVPQGRNFTRSLDGRIVTHESGVQFIGSDLYYDSTSTAYSTIAKDDGLSEIDELTLLVVFRREEDSGGYERLVTKGDPVSTTASLKQYLMQITNTDLVQFAINISSNTNSWINTTSSIEVGKDYTVCGTYTPGDQRLFLNGVQEAAAARTGSLSYGNFNWDLFLGKTGSDPSGKKTIKAVMVFNRALTRSEAEDITRNYTLGLKPANDTPYLFSVGGAALTPPTIGTVTGVSLTPTTARITVPVSFA